MADRRALGALLAVQVLFALWPIALKIVAPSTGLLGLMALRVVGAALLLAAGVIAWMRLTGRAGVPFRKHGRMLLLLCLLGVVLNQTLFVFGAVRTAAVNASLLITTIPVFTYAIAVLLGRETVGPRRMAGILLAMAGAVYLVGLSRFNAGWYTAAGDVMILLNALAFSAYLVLSKPLTTQYDALSVTMWTFVLAAIIYLPVGLALGTQNAVLTMDQRALWWLAFIIVGPSALTYVLNAVALRRVEASTVAVFIYLQPILTAIFAWYILSEPIGWNLLPAGILVFAGVWLVARRKPKSLRGAAPME